jgi:hypothetical protein
MAARVDQLPDENHMSGAETWHRILDATERLHANEPAFPQGLAKRGAHNSRNCC